MLLVFGTPSADTTVAHVRAPKISATLVMMGKNEWQHTVYIKAQQMPRIIHLCIVQSIVQRGLGTGNQFLSAPRNARPRSLIVLTYRRLNHSFQFKHSLVRIHAMDVSDLSLKT
jgi:hypothetical protein